MKVKKEYIQLMYRSGLTQVDISEITGLSQPTISNILSLKSPLKDREGERNRLREYARKNILWINGKWTKVNKRQRTNDICELCGQDTTGYRLCYHHWNDSKPEFGMWLCRGCHRFANTIENGIYNSYLGLKSDIEEGIK